MIEYITSHFILTLLIRRRGKNQDHKCLAPWESVGELMLPVLLWCLSFPMTSHGAGAISTPILWTGVLMAKEPSSHDQKHTGGTRDGKASLSAGRSTLSHHSSILLKDEEAEHDGGLFQTLAHWHPPPPWYRGIREAG